jgi:C2H2-type zinc finger
MAQVIETYCDGCLERGEQVRGKTYRATIGLAAGKAPTSDIDLCDDCAKPLTVLLEVLSDKGRPVGKSGRSKTGPKALAAAPPASGSSTGAGPVDSVPCPVNGCDAVSPSRKALRSHLRDHHENISIAEAYGDPLTHRCDVCGRGFGRAQSVMVHRTRAHPDAPSVESADDLRVPA